MNFLNTLNDLLWSYIIIVVLVGAALYFTIRSRGVQFTLLKDAVRIMLGRDRNDGFNGACGDAGADGTASAIKKSGSIRTSAQHTASATQISEPGSSIVQQTGMAQESRRMGSFQAFAVSLASRVGTGNLAGVASAIFVGGPGAVFWMWVMAFLGGATAFVESTLAQLYKRKGKSGFYGGPAFYMEKGLGARWMGVIFSTLMVFSFGLSNQLVQTNTIVDALSDSLGFGRLAVGLALGASLFIIAIGSIKTISKITSFLVPFMALGFIILSFVVVVTNLPQLPGVLKTIMASAFGIRQVGGGMVGAAILNGVKRGLFSNEAGEGSAPNAAAIAHTSHPVKQGAVQALGVFIDTILICTCTALIILLNPDWACGADGILLTTRCLEAEIGPVGKWFLTAAIFLFAFSTMLANYFYGENNIRFITKSMIPVWLFRVASFAVCTMASVMALQQIWTIMDIFMGLLTLTNVTAILLLSPKAFRLLEDYRKQRKQGLKDPVFNKHEVFPECADDFDAWK